MGWRRLGDFLVIQSMWDSCLKTRWLYKWTIGKEDYCGRKERKSQFQDMYLRPSKGFCGGRATREKADEIWKEIRDLNLYSCGIKEKKGKKEERKKERKKKKGSKVLKGVCQSACNIRQTERKRCYEFVQEPVNNTCEQDQQKNKMQKITSLTWSPQDTYRYEWGKTRSYVLTKGWLHV